MRKITFYNRLFFLINVFSLVFQLVAPLLVLAPVPAFADNISTTVSFDSGSNNFNFTITTDKQVNYFLAYETDKSVTQGVGPSTDQAPKGQNLTKTIYAGTESQGIKTPNHVVRSVLKTKVTQGNYLHSIWATVSGSLTVVHEEDATSLDLSSSETAFLGNGTLPQNNSPPATPEATPSSNSSNNNNNNNNNSTPAPSNLLLTSTVAGQATAPAQAQIQDITLHGNLSATIVKNTKPIDLDLTAPTANGSATVTTNKSDYSPTDTVVISGIGFKNNYGYTLEITSSNPPPVDFTTSIITTKDGTFVYAYQLDGNYRPNYSIDVKDSAGTTLASTTFTDSASSTTTVSNAVCLQDNPNSPTSLNCTANDISIASVSSITINGHGCRFPGDTVNFTANWQIQSSATSRYNVGLYFATSGQSSALTGGTCSVTSLPSSPAPFFDNGGSDTCGDIHSGSTGTLSITQTAVCNPDSNGFLKLPYCTSWQNNQQEKIACSTPTDAVPEDASKCNCQNGFTVPIAVPPSIEVIKSLVPASDSGRFNLQVNSTTATSSANVGNGGTTGKVGISIGSNTVGETAGTSTFLSNYVSSVSCVLRGTQTVVATTGSNP